MRVVLGHSVLFLEVVEIIKIRFVICVCFFYFVKDKKYI